MYILLKCKACNLHNFNLYLLLFSYDCEITIYVQCIVHLKSAMIKKMHSIHWTQFIWSTKISKITDFAEFSVLLRDKNIKRIQHYFRILNSCSELHFSYT